MSYVDYETAINSSIGSKINFDRLAFQMELEEQNRPRFSCFVMTTKQFLMLRNAGFTEETKDSISFLGLQIYRAENKWHLMRIVFDLALQGAMPMVVKDGRTTKTWQELCHEERRYSDSSSTGLEEVQSNTIR